LNWFGYIHVNFTDEFKRKYTLSPSASLVLCEEEVEAKGLYVYYICNPASELVAAGIAEALKTRNIPSRYIPLKSDIAGFQIYRALVVNPQDLANFFNQTDLNGNVRITPT
jgi:hypothetical protein